MRALAVVLVLAAALPASAQDPVDAAGWAERADALEDEARPREARDAWRALLELEPGSRLARRAERRVAWLDARSEGDFEPLAALQRFQRSDERDAAALERFAAEIDGMPAGRVRVEARMALGSAWGLAGDTDRALSAYRLLEGDPFLEPGEAEVLAEDVARLYAGVGRVDDALAALDHAHREESSSYGFLARAARRRVIEPIAWSVAGLFLVVTLVLVARARAGTRVRRAVTAPAKLLLVGQLALAPLALAHLLRDEAATAFDALAIVSALGLLGATSLGEAVAGEPVRVRLGYSALGALAVIAGAYLSVAYFGDALPFG